MILLMFLRCFDHAATSATTCILRFFVANFLQLVLHVGWGPWFTIWTILYLGTHSLASATHVQEICTFHIFACFCDFCVFFMISIISYIGSLSWTFRASDRSPNQFISTSSCVPAAQRYCLHQLQGSLKHINPGTSNMATASDLTLYSFCPCVSVILSKIMKPGVKSLIFLSS